MYPLKTIVDRDAFFSYFAELAAADPAAQDDPPRGAAEIGLIMAPNYGEQQMPNVDPAMKIDASPTKEFFIDILVRDIKLVDAIADLVDNCVDGARRLKSEGDFAGLSISIEFDRRRFRIEDNCGGIPVDVARNYAFRFGRPENVPNMKGSLGRFGVGMKRALFKMGEHFNIESKTANEKFTVDVDVNAWKSKRDDQGRELWEFEFQTLENVGVQASERGTVVLVDSLRPEIADEFGSKIFETRLIEALQAAHEQSVNQGLTIDINLHRIADKSTTLLVSELIKPIKVEKAYEVAERLAGESTPVKATIYAGIAESSLDNAGWYVVCNGRQILQADKTKTTGWDDVVNDVELPKAHNQFARFRGYIFFEGDNASALPWNTMKNAIDPESKVYQAALLDMATAMRQVIDFLNRLDAESDTESVELQEAIKKAGTAPLKNVGFSSTFVYPTPGTAGQRSRPLHTRIAFTRATKEVDFAKEFFEVGTAKTAGERTFEYFLEREML